MDIRSVTQKSVENGEQLYEFTHAVTTKDIDGKDVTLARKETRSRESIEIDLAANLQRVQDFTKAAEDCQALLDAIKTEEVKG